MLLGEDILHGRSFGMDSCTLDAKRWALDNFGDCDFNDSRLTNRLVGYAASVAQRPDDATPQQSQTWKECKGVYRFMDNKKVSFSEIVRPHCERTRSMATSGVWLSICDTTEISFRKRRKIDGLRPVGNGIGQGFYLHSSLLVSDSTDEILGLAGQELFYRIDAGKHENTANRKKRERESEVWGRVVNAIGKPLPGATIIHVCDREADDYDFYCHLVNNEVGWVVRASRLNRKVYKGFEGNTIPNRKNQVALKSIVDSSQVIGEYELEVLPNKKQKGRIAKLDVRCTTICMPIPIACSPWAKQHGPKFIRMGVIDVREKSAPKSTDPLHWVLYTHENVSTFEDAWRVIGRYEKRPLIEDYHKAAKTGAQIEERLYRTAERQERVVGILSVMAVRLLQMKTIARVKPEKLASEIAPKKWILAVCAIQREQQSPAKKTIYDPRTITVRDFFRGLAMLGGFLGRKRDGEPGWITVWRGVKELLLALRLQRALLHQETTSTYG